MIRRILTPIFYSAAIIGTASAAIADSWREPKPLIEWKFKLGAVSVALENCPFKKGPRHAEAVTNADTVKPAKKLRSYDEGRKFMLILDGPDKSQLCGVAYKFFGPTGTDLSELVAPDTDAASTTTSK